MAEIMGTFAHDLDNFVAYYEKLNWDTSFRGEAYPPRIVMEQCTPPLFIVEDGQKKLVPNPTIQIIGRPETEVITTGKLQIGKKGFHKADQPRRRSAGAVPARLYAGAQGNGGGKC
jgi:hypothetical protein